MTTPLWTGGPVPSGAALPSDLPPATRQLLDAVRSGKAAGLLPPVLAPGPDGTLVVLRHLGGTDDARFLCRHISAPAFLPLHALLSRLAAWCEATAPDCAGLIAPGVLHPLAPGIFGPLINEAFVLCASRHGRPLHEVGNALARRSDGHLAFLDLFLSRLRRDLGTPERPGLRGPVTAIACGPGETHNGGQRVLRLQLAAGRCIAYKPRPATGELLFLSEEGVFALVNTLAPASGSVRLPVLPTWAGSPDPGGQGSGHYWQEWAEPVSGPRTVLRREGRHRLHATVLDPDAADRYWHGAGSLAAAAVAFGLGDLHAENVLTAVRADATESRLYPVDLEIYFLPVRHLHDTGLLPAAGDGHHHTGIENHTRWCAPGGPDVHFAEATGKGLALYRRRKPMVRDQDLPLIVDGQGRAGYTSHLTSLVRGMFDAWTLICRHRKTLRDRLGNADGPAPVRVLRRPTASYDDALHTLLTGGVGPTDGFEDCEQRQLERGDVPYFFRTQAGGPLLTVPPAPNPFRPVAAVPQPTGAPAEPPAADVRRGAHWTLAGLGPALRDAVEHVRTALGDAQITDDGRGVRVRLTDRGGSVTLDWVETRHRVTYAWNATTLRLRVDALRHVPTEVRSRLLRLDRLDAVLREQWADGGFTDVSLEAELRRLTGAALAWLRDVVAELGWPGPVLVGKTASGAAARLLQHADDSAETQAFRKHCLTLLAQAADGVPSSRRDIAYLTDSILLADGLPQRFGTKFRKEGGRLVPCPLEPGDVDRRRADVGLDPLNHYAKRLNDRFGVGGFVDPAERTTP